MTITLPQSEVPVMPVQLKEYRVGSECPHSYDGAFFSIIPQILFDFDYDGIFAFCQVWDYRLQDHPIQAWQYVLMYRGEKFSHTGSKERAVYHWGTQYPSISNVARVVESFMNDAGNSFAL